METDPIRQFVAEARAFCAFMERAASLSLEDRLLAARDRLLALYTAGLALPALPEAVEQAPAPESHDLESWSGFGAVDVYWEVFDPYVEADHVAGSLSDDLLDVHDDVRRGLTLWDRQLERQAIWDWRFHLNAHWGDHAIDALRALHRAIRDVRGFV